MTDPEQSPAGAKPDYTVDAVISKDGTKIGYRRYGAGPAVVLVQGAIGTTQHFHQLAASLARDFTVYVPERRGRPLSPRDYGADHNIERELDDLAAVFERADAHLLFGLSSGAVIALEAARVFPSVDKVVLYEAPLYVPPLPMRLDLVARFHRQVERGHIAAAMLTALVISGFAPPFLKGVPRPLVEAALALFLRRDARRQPRDYPPLRELVPTIRFDFSVVGSMQNKFETFKSVKSSVLLLSCAKSPKYLRDSAVALGQVLSRPQHVEFADLDHSSPWNADRGGRPIVVATTLRAFFEAATDTTENLQVTSSTPATTTGCHPPARRQL